MSTDKCSLLVVDDEPYILATLCALLNSEYEVVTAESAEVAQKILLKRPIDLLLTVLWFIELGVVGRRVVTSSATEAGV